MNDEEARCSCGAVLSRYRDPGEDLCAPCRKAAAQAEPLARVLDGEALVYAAAGVLMLARGLGEAEPVNLRERLRMLGVEADHCELWQAVQKLRRRYGMVIDAEARQTGYRLREWPYRFFRNRKRTRQA